MSMGGGERIDGIDLHIFGGWLKLGLVWHPSGGRASQTPEGKLESRFGYFLDCPKIYFPRERLMLGEIL